VWASPGVPPSSYFPRAALLTSLLSFQREETPPQCPLTSCNLIDIPATRFMTSCPRVYLMVLLNALLLPRYSCCLRSQFLIPLLHSGPFHHLFSTVSPLWLQPLFYAGRAWWLIHLWVAANFFQDPLSPRVHSFSCWQHHTVICQSPYWSSSAPIVSTAAFSLGTSSSFLLYLPPSFLDRPSLYYGCNFVIIDGLQQLVTLSGVPPERVFYQILVR
jgi:hypothetical protein